jgi:hypothetical protein
MKANLTPSEQFKTLWQFFAEHPAEVEARGAEDLSPEQKIALAELASGKADHAARMQLIPLLRSNRQALAYLGEQIKLMRPGAERRRPSGNRPSQSAKS